MNTTVQNKAAKPIISDETEAQILGAFRTLFTLMGNYGDAIDSSKPGRAEFERIAARSVNALEALKADRREREVAMYRDAVRGVIASHLDTARQEKAEFDSLSPSLKAKLGAFPTFVYVPVSEVTEVFQGAPEADIVKKLVAMSYKVAKTAGGALALKIDLPKSILEGSAA